ncbi:MAG: nicotinate (nicotinamide) nucleotide adenylyltransferase [Clostridia bacterium]|nr:nicotinate (nicotinamide) nucleotide adenylyltransferase [Clostridia bacterium]
MLRVGIYGGTFSPIHTGHVEAAKAFMSQMWLDVLFVIPTGVSPHKEMSEGVSNADRLRMCELAFEGVEGVIVSDMEMCREGKSYTVDTLRELTDTDRRLFLLCGTDMILTLDQWRDPDEIFRLAYPTYIRREEDAELDEKLVAKITEYRNKYGKNVVRINSPAVVVSSSEVRAKIGNGEDITGLVPPAVAEYIKEKGLYAK